MICNPKQPGMAGFTDWFYGLVEESVGVEPAVAAGGALLSPAVYLGEGARYAVKAGVDAAGRAVNYIWDTSTDEVVDVMYGAPSAKIPVHTGGAVLPTSMTRSTPGTFGGESDPGATARMLQQSWESQQKDRLEFFGQEAERGKQKEEDRSILLYLLIAGGAVLLLR